MSKVVFASEQQAKDYLGIDQAKAAVAFTAIDPIVEVRPAQTPGGNLIVGGPPEFIGQSPFQIAAPIVFVLMP